MSVRCLPRNEEFEAQMSDPKSQFDIFICGGSKNFEALEPLLKLLHPFGCVHLGSSYLNSAELLELADDCDLIHQPRHDPDGYNNFELFCCRDLNDLATAEHFIKIDSDVLVAPNWIDYVMEGLERYPEAVLFGPGEGSEINVSIEGALAEQLFGRDL